MLQRGQLEHVTARFPSQVAELRSFLLASSVVVDTAAALSTVVLKLKGDRDFHRDLQSHLWAILCDTNKPIHSADLMGILTVAVAGVDLATSAQSADAHDLLRFVMEVRTSLGSTWFHPSDGPSVGKSSPRWVYSARPHRTTTLLRAGAVFVILLLGFLLLRKRAPYSWQAEVSPPVESQKFASGPKPALPMRSSAPSTDSRVDEESIAAAKTTASTAAPPKHVPMSVPAPSSVSVLPSSPASRAVAFSAPRPETTDASPLRISTVEAAPSADSDLQQRASTAARPVPRAIPTSVLSQRLGARSLPFTSPAEESLYYPDTPVLRRRSSLKQDGSLLAENALPTLHVDHHTAAAGIGMGSVHPVSLGTMASNILYSPTPAYPAAAAAAHVEGEVRVEAEVDRNGNVASARVISGPPLLRDAAVDAVQHWRYRPFVASGRAVAMSATAVVEFQLQ